MVGNKSDEWRVAFRVENVMNAPEPNLVPEASISLEAVELELALGLQDLQTTGFENCVAHAAETTGGSLLFHMPVEFIPGIQRVAAVLAGTGVDQRTVMVTLNDRGDTMSVEDTGNGNAFAGLASSYAGLVSTSE